MLNRKKLRIALEAQTYNGKSGFLRWIEKQVIQTNCDLSDNYCRFYINSTYQIRGNNIILEIYCVPTEGVFSGIEFRPKIFINSANFIERPKIYNDRRIFHPNINVYTCQFVSKELVLDWNPTKEFSVLLRHLKYLLIQPNCTFVSNNPYNRRAAWNFHFNQANYRPLLQKYCPLYLDNIISDELTNQLNRIQIETPSINVQSSSTTDSLSQNDFWNINSILSQKKTVSVEASFEVNTSEEEQNFHFLAKQIKRIDFHQKQQQTKGEQIIWE